MPYPEMKNENYRNIGGINHKASVYVTGATEFLSLFNFDHQVPGAINKRWGTTNGLSGNTLAFFGNFAIPYFGFQYYDVSLGLETVLVGSGGAFFLGTNANSYGQSFSMYWPMTNGAFANGAGNAVVINPISGNQFAVFTSGNILFKLPTAGSTLFYYGVPSYTGSIALSGTMTGSPILASGSYFFLVTFKDALNVEGGWTDGTIFGATLGQHKVTLGPSMAVKITLSNDATNNNLFHGVFSKVLYVAGPYAGSNAPADPSEFHSFDEVALTATSDVYDGSISGVSHTLFEDNADRALPFAPFNGLIYASWIETYYNRLFRFSAVNSATFASQNVLQWTDAIENNTDAQLTPTSNFATVGSGKYPASGIKFYNQRLMLFTKKEVLVFAGNDNTNFFLTPISDQYGCVNGKSVVIFENKCWFLDEKRIVEYNGSQVQIISQRVEHLLNQMDIVKAWDQATALYEPTRNEVWFAFPTVGSVTNDMILIYNHVTDSWSRWNGFRPAALMQLFQGASSITQLFDQKAYYASIGGSLCYFGTSFGNDDGQGITLQFRTRDHNEPGESSTFIWRRYYQDMGAWSGLTMAFTAKMFANYATNAVAATTSFTFSGSNYSGQQQVRIDLGVPAKAFGIEVTHGSTTGFVTIAGYSLDRRYLRSV